jgi:hypothetical protein
MSSEFLWVHRDNAEEILDEAMPLMLGKKLSYDQLVAICENYRIKGIAQLLLDVEPARLHRALHDSAQAFLFGLAGVPADQIIVSAAAPLFDAVACLALPLARQIAAALPLKWQSDVEYEEDFLQVSFLCRHFLLDQPVEAGRDLERLAELAPDEPMVRVCQALVARDGEAFATAFADFLAAYQKRQQTYLDAERLAPEAAATLPFFCTEGLALLRFAESLGLPLESEYPTIPAIARGDWSASFDARAWQRPKG